MTLPTSVPKNARLDICCDKLTGGSVTDPPVRCEEIPLVVDEYAILDGRAVVLFGRLGGPVDLGVAVNADAAADVGDDGDGGGPVTMYVL
jgi:hypothetical protein